MTTEKEPPIMREIKALQDSIERLQEQTDKVLSSSIQHDIGLAKIVEHLKTLNGAVARHEKNFTAINDENNRLWECINKHFQEDAKFTGQIEEWKSSITRDALIKGGGIGGSIGGSIGIIAALLVYALQSV